MSETTTLEIDGAKLTVETSAHLDRLLKEVMNAALEKVADYLESIRSDTCPSMNISKKIRAMKEQP